MRIALAYFGMESSTFTPVRTSRSDLIIKYENFVLPELAKCYSDEGVELVPIMVALGQPSGLLETESYESIKSEMLERLEKSAPFDGIVLSMHGSMLIEDGRHGELDFLTTLRARFGKDFPIGVRLDLHGNIPDGFVELATVISALRTAPHRDMPETLIRVSKLLIKIIRERLKPVTHMVRLPLLFPGEWVMTDNDPGRSLYGQLAVVDTHPGVLSASIMVGFAWADIPYAGASVIVTALSREVATIEAEALAKSFFDQREKFKIDGESASVKDAVREAMVSTIKPVFISDSGDNITAGAPGDGTQVLLELLDAGATNVVFAQIADAESYDICFNAGVGATVTLLLGGKVENVWSKPIKLVGHVHAIADLNYGSAVVFESAGIQILITAKRFPIATKEEFSKLNIDIMAASIGVFKVGYLVPPLAEINKRGIIALSSGCTTLDITSLPFSKVRRPIFPLDRI